jgi:hypothetical protein
MTTLDIDKRNGHESKDWASLREWTRAIGIMGVGSVIALYLVYVGANEIPKLLQNQRDQLAKQDQILANQHMIMGQNATIIRSVKRACENAAKDTYARDRCD